uniref:Uncharacterized protein n=1 Tax=Opuntia streptacantha TaxID=393608 RepID=A0A7C9D6I3_OPUST
MCPGAPANRRRGEIKCHARSHFGLKLALKTLSISHGSFSVLLLLLHIDVHMPHRYFVVELRHPAVIVLPRLPVRRHLLRFLRRLWRCRRWRRRLFLGFGQTSTKWGL